MGPQVAQAQKSDRTRRIGVLIGSAENDPQTEQHLKALQEALRALGWVDKTFKSILGPPMMSVACSHMLRN
jgi:hypothetical protein